MYYNDDSLTKSYSKARAKSRQNAWMRWNPKDDRLRQLLTDVKSFLSYSSSGEGSATKADLLTRIDQELLDKVKK